MEADEARTPAKLKSLRDELVHPTIGEHHGRIVKLMGDGLLVEFASAVHAVGCAIALQGGHGDAPANRKNSLAFV